MSDKFEDWSPASVFGATTPEPGRQRRPSFRDLHEEKYRQTGGYRSQGGERSAFAPAPPARRATTTKHQQENQLVSTPGDEQVATPSPLRRTMKTSSLQEIKTREHNFIPAAIAASLDGHSGVPGGRSSRRRSRQSHINSDVGLTASTQTEERNLAARVLQKHARVLLLRRREQESLQEVNALRFMLKQAAATLLAQWHRRCCSRRAIRAYLSYWWHQESRIQGLLRQVEVKKRRREADLTTMMCQRHQEQLQARQQRASSLISQWWAARVVLRQHRKESLRLRAKESQRRIACWYRRNKVEQRCQEKARLARRHQAALQIQQTYRKACRRRSEHLHRRLAGKKTICDCIQRFLARKKNRKQRREAQSALKIQIFYRQRKEMRDARLELVRRREVYQGVQALSTIVHRRKLKSAYSKRLVVWKFFQQQEQQRQNTCARLLQLTFRACATRRKREREYTSALHIQRVFRGYQARQLCHQLRKQRRKLVKKQRKRDAATKIQSRIRGFLARARFAKLMKQLRDRFRCSNCGVIEPSGVYCKICGRKRMNFDLLVMGNKRALSLYSGSQHGKKPDDQHKAGAGGGGFYHLVPVRPISPPSFPKLQAGKNGKL